MPTSSLQFLYVLPKIILAYYLSVMVGGHGDGDEQHADRGVRR